MQERVAKPEAVDSEPTWYLTRGGEQLGPLTGRELSLFAEGGNFKSGDLVWTAGFDAWKPADDVFGLTASPESQTQEASEPANETSARGEEASESVTFSLPSSPKAEAADSPVPTSRRGRRGLRRGSGFRRRRPRVR